MVCSSEVNLESSHPFNASPAAQVTYVVCGFYCRQFTSHVSLCRVLCLPDHIYFLIIKRTFLTYIDSVKARKFIFVFHILSINGGGIGKRGYGVTAE